MYHDHFRLADDPFSLGPNLRFLYRSRAHAETMAHLGYGLEQGEDIILISGPIGTGKTLALANLQRRVSSAFRTVVINVTSITFRDFLKMLLSEMERPLTGPVDMADLLVAVKKAAREVAESGRRILLIVDESQNLDAETLEGIRMLTNLGQPDQGYFQIVLAGQPALEQKIGLPELAQLKQRIRIHYRLETLSEEETGEYIAHRIKVAGREEPLFSAGAVHKIHQLSGGVPRLVNHHASHALLAAFVDRASRVDADHVDVPDMPEAPRPDDGAAAAAVAAGAVPAAEAAAVRVQMPPPVVEDSDTRGAPLRTTRRQAPPPPPRSRPVGMIVVWSLIAVVLGAAAWWLVWGDQQTMPPFDAASWLPDDQQDRREALVNESAAEAESAVPADAGEEGTSGGEAPPSATDATADAAIAANATPPAAQPAIPPAATVRIHVASFRDFQRADRYAATLRDAGAVVEVEDKTFDDGHTWRRVLLGPYASWDAAEQELSTFEEAGLVTFYRRLDR